MAQVVPDRKLRATARVQLWASISEQLNVLFEHNVIELLNRSLLNVVQAEGGEVDVKNRHKHPSILILEKSLRLQLLIMPGRHLPGTLP